MNEPVVIARELLASIGVAAAQPELTPMHGGRSGALTFRVEVGSQAYALRIQPEERFTKHFSQLAELQSLAGEAGVAPAVLAVDDRRRAMLSEHIPTEPLIGTLRSSRGLELLSRIGQQLGILHELTPPQSLADRCPTVRTRELLQELCSDGPEFVRRAAVSVTSLEPGPKKAVCHLDLNPTNILFDGEGVRFVDWETAGISDPAFDLATVINLLMLDSASRGALLRGYARSTTPPTEARLEAARRHVYLGYGAEFLRLAGAPAPDWKSEELPALAEAYGEIALGKLDMATQHGQWRLGAAYLGELFRMGREPLGNLSGVR
ncbi:MAG: phosphotransferase [Polyangiaceae bacterium]|nr:phosphotransferase [Polyangiaceae bacterium]